MRKTKIETTPEVKALNFALEFFDSITQGSHDKNPNLAQLARIADESGLPKTAEVFRFHIAK